MFRATFLRCLMIAGVLAFASSSMWAQTTSKSATTQKSAAKTFRGRLPNGFGKLGLTQAQKDLIYGIQGKYSMEIEDLETRIAELKAKQNAEILTVLSEDQKTALNASQKKPKTTAKASAAETAPEE